jgi:hypothetical protein
VRAVALLALALVLAGCASQPAPVPAAAQAVVPDGIIPFQPAVVATADCARCIEPTIAVDHQGRIFVAGFRQPGIMASSDNGQTYAVVAPPPFPSPSPLAGSGSDDLVQVAPWGELFFTRLMTESFYNTPGVQVAGSLDGGQSWTTNVFVHPRTVPGDTAFVSDRQWLAFDGDSRVYLVYNSGASVTETVVRSDDRGATFGSPVIAVTTADHTFPSPAGMPSVGLHGELVIPYFITPRTDGNIGAHGLGVAVSSDGGLTFTNDQVYQHESLATGAGFPDSIALSNGTFVVAWSTNDGSAWFAFSSDGGKTWPDPLQIAPDVAHAGSYPWMDPRPDGGFDAVWFAGHDTSRVGRFTPDAPIRFGDMAGKMGGTTDFSTLAHLIDGRAISAFGTGDGALTTIAEAGPASPTSTGT